MPILTGIMPGRMIISAPANPIKIATMRCPPIRSPRKAAAMKQGKSKEEEVRSVKDKEGLTPADVAKQKRDKLPPVTNAEEGGAAQEERRKFDKIVEWLEKGLPRN